jgi:peptidoglycan hydrolase-like protein with peptidoglycan-binding domain
MRRLLLPLLVLAGLVLPAAALAGPTAPALPGATKSRPAAKKRPAAAHLSLAVTRSLRDGRRRLTLTGQRVRFTGRIRPYVPHQSVTVKIWRGHRLLRTRRLIIRTHTGRTGYFTFTASSGSPGRLTAAAVHPKTRDQAHAAAHSGTVLVYRGFLGPGASGPFVRLVQQRMRAIGYAVVANGRFDARTARGALAFRKVNRFARTSTLDRWMIGTILAGHGSYKARYPGHGRHVEADLSRQVMAEFNGARVHRIYVVSSGKPSTPTVLGSFRFYRKQPGTNSHGMVYSSYFTGGYAIHGYSSVPTYAASHGCLRIPIPDAIPVYSWIHIGDRIDVYPR